jgi:hypothetical protein
MSRYRVMVDDNFHYQDESERREHGVYETLEEARAACRALVDRSLVEEYRPGISAERLFDRYKSFGEDPFILAVAGANDGVLFSAWTYAEERCAGICGA